MSRILLFLFLFITCSSLPSLSQSRQPASLDKVYSGFINQSTAFPQEKIHLHSDKTDYVSGEHIWFKAYVLNSLSHEPIALSRYVYVELVNPLNLVVKRVKVRYQDGVYQGYIPVPENLPEGNYSLRAYTYFMKNLPEDYFFRMPVSISHPESFRITAGVDFTRLEQDRVDGNLLIKGNFEKLAVNNKDLELKYNNKNVSYRILNDSTVRFSLRPETADTARIIYMAYRGLRKYIPVPAGTDDYEVYFFPEGGQLIPDQLCRIAFKSLRPDGNPEDIEGELLGANGQVISQFNSLHGGMGSFTVIPRTNETYKVRTTTANGKVKTFTLPAPIGNGWSLKIDSSKDMIYLSALHHGRVNRNERLYYMVHSRGYLLNAGEFKTRQEYMAFQKDEFPAGVLHFILVDANSNILSERLFFCDNGKQGLDVNFSTDKASYRTRDRVTASVSVPGSVADMSIAITDDKDITAGKGPSILATMLLTSDLKGYISDPEYYFGDDDAREREQALDLLMMTNGWRRYDISKVLKGDYAYPTEPLEVGQTITGNIRTLVRKRPVINTEVSIISPERSFFVQTTTDSLGNFYLDGFEFPDSTNYVIQALNPKGNDRVMLNVDEVIYPDVNIAIPPDHDFVSNRDYVQKSDNKYIMENGMRVIDIDKIEVVGIQKDEYPGLHAEHADDSFTLQDIEELDATCLHELLRRVPGVDVFNDQIYIRTQNSIYGDNIAAIYIDGVAVGGDYDLHVISMPDVARVDVFKGGNTIMFGATGANGVVSVTTKSGKFTPPDTPKFNMRRMSPLGFQTPVEFYSPRYDTAENRVLPTADLRTTILWKPDLRTDEQGNSQFEFYTSDSYTTYTVIIEGVSEDGGLIRKVDKIIVE